MLQRNDVVGQRIKRIVANTSRSDDDYNFADFVCELRNGIAFRLPSDDETGDLFPGVKITEDFRTIKFDKPRWFHYNYRLWWARITDVLVPADPELRFPDSAVIALSSGWYIAQRSGAPRGILPLIDIMPTLNVDEEMMSVWQTTRQSPMTTDG